MARIARLGVLALGALLAISCGSTSHAATASRTYAINGRAMAACLIKGAVSGRCGALTVPENRADPNGRTIEIKVDLIPAESASVTEPVFFIAGGPGSSTIEQWMHAGTTFPGLNVHHDIVLVDQRGTGGSHLLQLPPPIPDESPDSYVPRALASIDGDPRYYTTAVAMDDLDAVRQAMGYSKIDLYGGSYGATAVQYYLRQHGEHVKAAVLDGGTLLDVPLFELIPASSQQALDDVFARCLSGAACSAAFPNVRTEFATVLQRLDSNPVATSWYDPTGQRISVTHEFFAGVIHSQLLNAGDSAGIPWLIHRAWSGDFSDVLRIAASQDSSTQMLVMSVEIRCAEYWARFDPAQVNRLGAGSYYMTAQLQAAQNQQLVCSRAPAGFVPANDAQPVRTQVPVLLLNGGDDPQGPPSNVAGAAQQMPNSLSVSVPGQGHVVGALGCLPSVVVAYFDTGKPNPSAAATCATSVPLPTFRLS